MRLGMLHLAAGLLALLFTPGMGRTESEALRLWPTRVGKYEKVEFDLPVTARYKNPFDPGEVDVTILLKTPSGRRVSLPAFYDQPFERQKLTEGSRQVDWMYPVGKPRWKARFAPTETGTYEAVARRKDRRGHVQSEVVRFESRPSEHPGFLRVSRHDPRFLEFSEGRPFFAIGQNLAFIGESQYATLSKAEAMFGKLAANGANYLRIWTCCEDWAMALEARKSAWGRSWAWKPPIVPIPDPPPGQAGRKCIELTDAKPLQVSPSHPVALRPDTQYTFALLVRGDRGTLRVELNGATWEERLPQGNDGWATLTREFSTGADERWLRRLHLRLDGGKAWIDGLSLRESAGGPELLWEADVNRPIRGYYNPIDCFMLDEIVRAAEARGLYLQLCLITRDLYMEALQREDSPEYQEAIDDAKRFLRYVVARWGYSTHVAAWEYFNEINPGLPTNRFYQELGEYLEQIDPYRHLRTTSTWAPSVKDCRHAKLDIAEVHYYLRPSELPGIRNEVEAVLDRTAFLREHAPAKPVLIGEFGLATDDWRPNDLMREDAGFVHFHNALWASALAGGSGTALFWWWEELDRKNAYHHYRPLAAFLADVPFTTAQLETTSASLSRAELRLVGLQGPTSAYLWIFDPHASWIARRSRETPPEETQGVALRVPGLSPGTYRVAWWHTGQGRTVGEETVRVSGELRLDVPPFCGDLAAKLIRQTGLPAPASSETDTLPRSTGKK